MDRIGETLGADPADCPPQEPRLNVSPGEDVLVCLPGRRLTLMRWGILPVGRVNARGRPVMETLINIRGETAFKKSAFDGLSLCLVPADGWYEWTGKTRKKTAWRITARDKGVLAFAALWDRWLGPGGVEIRQVATVTCEPNADVAPIHNRMGVLLSPEDQAIWLGEAKGEPASLVRPAIDGSLDVNETTDPNQLT